MELFIREINIEKNVVGVNYSEYPFNLTLLRHFKGLKLRKNVTFLVGENGTGKSTLLEAVAVGCGFNPEGGSKNFQFSTSDTHSILHKYISIIKGFRMPKDGYFLRAESFYNVSSEIDKHERESFGMLMSYGGKSLHQQSHGESFMSLVLNRFWGNGLYLLDEPEAALSPQRQLALISLIGDLVKKDSQFIIATHSPILLAFPDADIYTLTENGINLTPYKETEHYALTKDFLNNPEGFLKHLLD